MSRVPWWSDDGRRQSNRRRFAIGAPVADEMRLRQATGSHNPNLSLNVETMGSGMQFNPIPARGLWQNVTGRRFIDRNTARKVLMIPRPVVALLMIVCCTAEARVNVPKEGKYDNFTCYSGVHHLLAAVKGQAGGSYHLLGTAVSKEGDIFNNASVQCAGAYTLVGEDFHDMGSCTITDADGDAFFGVYGRTRLAEPGTWKVTGGTGKYEGILSDGTYLPATDVPAPAGFLQVCDKLSGRWKLR